jgi:tetrahydromethanopterin S-methyltransferase subunit G
MSKLTPNEEWAKEMIMYWLDKDADPKYRISKRDFNRIKKSLDDLDGILYKSWSKLLSLQQLRNVMNDISIK